MSDTEETTFTAKQLARKVGTDPKTLRKFLRSTASPVEAVGQGGRYEFDSEAAELISNAFKTWSQVRPTKLKEDAVEEIENDDVSDEAPAPKPKRRSRSKKAVEVEAVEDAIEELEDMEPTAEELEDLDDLFEELED
jgi:Lon protease-like protein